MEAILFSSSISKVIFSPYWNVPQSILDNEIKPAIEKDPDYLTKYNLEWKNKSLRQRHGPTNAMGVVKFLFPNTYSIYLHDMPFKLNFNYEFPRFSHGCINMQKAKELAYLILKNNPDWPLDKINKAMDIGVENVCVLKKPISLLFCHCFANPDTVLRSNKGGISFYFSIFLVLL